MAFVRTVAGDVDPAQIGFTLPHEHTVCHLWRIPERFDYWELTADEDLISAELARFRDAGGTCIADVTLAGIGRDPAWLRRLAARTGLHIVMGCGWYREPYYPPEDLVDRRSVEQLADVIVAEFTEGVPGSEGPDGTRVPSDRGSSGRSASTSPGSPRRRSASSVRQDGRRAPPGWPS
jgi:predicted metal-dependent phosphotriesterase family hydrolase